MSLDFTLLLNTTSEPVEILFLLAEASASARSGSPELTLAGLWMTCFVVDAKRRDHVRAAYGFSPNVGLEFVISAGDLHQKGRESLARVVAQLLSKCKDQAILLFNGEQTVLTRLGSDVLVDEAWAEWLLETTAFSCNLLPARVEKLSSPLI